MKKTVTGGKKSRKLGRTPKGFVSHAEEGDPISPEDVKYVAILGEAEPGIGFRRQILEDPAGDGADVAGDGGKLRQHQRFPRHHRV